MNTGGAGGGYRTMSAEELRDMFGTDDPFSDFFKTFFGGGGARAAPNAGAAAGAAAARARGATSSRRSS